MTYSVKEMYYTLQGEGALTGRPAVFLRFAGCNLWTGREKDRHKAICKFCDTQFVGTDGIGGGKFSSPDELASAAIGVWPNEQSAGSKPYVVCTGGEPLLQLDSPAILALQACGFEVAVETNGTIAAPPELDWICVSPKAGAKLAQVRGDELKLVYPQVEMEAQPSQFAALDFQHYFLQPLDDEHRDHNTRAAIDYCLANPVWKLSLQTHKIIGIA
jgi:7-carboxy-7-deazaguanine synthase (Cx14CxxC type)